MTPSLLLLCVLRDHFTIICHQNKIIRPPFAILLIDFQEWEYNIDSSDWINTMTGELLTNYKIPSHLQVILSENIDLIHN